MNEEVRMIRKCSYCGADAELHDCTKRESTSGRFIERRYLPDADDDLDVFIDTWVQCTRCRKMSALYHTPAQAIKAWNESNKRG